MARSVRPPAASGREAKADLRALRPSAAQRRYLLRGLRHPAGSLPLFDENGQSIVDQTVQACLKAGWIAPRFDALPWPGWMLCRLTAAGRAALNPRGTGR